MRNVFSLALALALAVTAACASAPPQGAIDEATRQVTANEAIAKKLGADYKATYSDRSIQSASLGTRVVFDLIGQAGSGVAEFQCGQKGGAWDASHMTLTFHDLGVYRLRDGKWQAADR